MAEPRIVAIDDSILVVWKPPRLHSAALSAGGGPNLVGWVLERFPGLGCGPGPGLGPGRRLDAEAGLLHRLDYETAGLLLFARTEEAFTRLRAAQEAQAILKTYQLEASPSFKGLPGSRPLRGNPEGLSPELWAAALANLASLPGLAAGRSISCRFRAYGPKGAQVACLSPGEAVPGAHRRGSPPRLYRTEIEAAAAGGLTLHASVRLAQGFRHQIRAHFAWIGLPLQGDSLYGGQSGPALALEAVALEFPHPVTGRHERVAIDAVSIAKNASLPYH
ncbi:MAG: pseudouridine synthase [Spirochaetota bacterium]